MISRKTTISAAALLLASAGAAAAFPATATSDLNVRSGPGTGYSVIDSLEAGDTVEIVSTRGSWYQTAEGGWANGAYLDAEGSASIDDGYAVVDASPGYYGTPAFYYGSDPYYWDDSGYYWYFRAGQRHRVGWDWFRDRDHDSFRWSNTRYRRDFESRRGRWDSDRTAGRNWEDNDGRRGGASSDANRLERVERPMRGEGTVRTGRASAEQGVNVDGRVRGGETQLQQRGGEGQRLQRGDSGEQQTGTGAPVPLRPRGGGGGGGGY